MLNPLHNRKASIFLRCSVSTLLPCVTALGLHAAETKPTTAPPPLRVASKQPQLSPVASGGTTTNTPGAVTQPAPATEKVPAPAAKPVPAWNPSASAKSTTRQPLVDKPVTSGPSSSSTVPPANGQSSELIDQFIHDNWDPRSGGSRQLPRRTPTSGAPEYTVPSTVAKPSTTPPSDPESTAGQTPPPATLDDGFTGKGNGSSTMETVEPSLPSTTPTTKPNPSGTDALKQRLSKGQLDWVTPDVVAEKGTTPRSTTSPERPSEVAPKSNTKPSAAQNSPPRTTAPQEASEPTGSKFVPLKRVPVKPLQEESATDLDDSIAEEMEPVPPSVEDAEPPARRSLPIKTPNVSGKTTSTPSQRRDRDPGDDAAEPERSAPAEISSDDMDEVEIESDDGSTFKQNVERLPKLVTPAPKGSMAPTKPEATPLVIRASVARLKTPIAECLKYYYRRPEDMAKRSPWGTFHSVLPFGVDGKVVSRGRTYNGLAWLCSNNPCRGQRILSTTRDGHIAALEGIGLQGHQAQLLAILGQSGVPLDYPIYVNKRKFTVADLVKSEQNNCRAGAELTFSLIGLSAYLPTDTRWRASDGAYWDFERLLAEEMAQPVVGAACGGTHRMMGFSYSLRQRRLENLPVTGQWDFATTYVEDFFEYAWAQQNPDGSFSTNWFEGRADNGELDRKLQTSGHILEWLVFTSPREQLQDDRTVRAVTFILNTLTRDKSHSFEVGPKGHALRSLALYYARIFEDPRPWEPPTVQANRGNRVR